MGTRGDTLVGGKLYLPNGLDDDGALRRWGSAYATTELQVRFFEELTREAPFLVAELETIGAALDAHGRRLGVDLTQALVCQAGGYDMRPAETRDDTLVGPLREWADAHRLDVPWLVAGFAHTLHEWARGRSPGRLVAWWARMSCLPFDDETSTFTHTATLPDPTETGWTSELRNRLVDDYRRALDARCAQLDAAAHARGFRKVPEYRDAAKHLGWMVRFQVLGQSHETIAGAAGVSRPAVSQILERLHVELGLPQRVVTRGPRRGSTHARPAGMPRMRNRRAAAPDR